MLAMILDEILPLQLIAANLGGSIVSLDISSERHGQIGVNETAQISKRQQVVSNPGHFDRKPDALPHEHRAMQFTKTI